MTFIDLPTTVYEIEIPGGGILKTSGCSLPGKVEFQELLKRIFAITQNASEEMPAHLAYLTDSQFQSLCHRALELNYISPTHLTFEQIYSLLLKEDAPLIAINFPQG